MQTAAVSCSAKRSRLQTGNDRLRAGGREGGGGRERMGGRKGGGVREGAGKGRRMEWGKVGEGREKGGMEWGEM